MRAFEHLSWSSVKATILGSHRCLSSRHTLRAYAKNSANGWPLDLGILRRAEDNLKYKFVKTATSSGKRDKSDGIGILPKLFLLFFFVFSKSIAHRAMLYSIGFWSENKKKASTHENKPQVTEQVFLKQQWHESPVSMAPSTSEPVTAAGNPKVFEAPNRRLLGARCLSEEAQTHTKKNEEMRVRIRKWRCPGGAFQVCPKQATSSTWIPMHLLALLDKLPSLFYFLFVEELFV